MLIDLNIYKEWSFANYLIIASAIYGVVQLVKMLINGGKK